MITIISPTTVLDPICYCAYCWAPIYKGDNYVETKEGVIFCTQSCQDECLEDMVEVQNERASA